MNTNCVVIIVGVIGLASVGVRAASVGRIYWADSDSQVIQSANLDGTGLTTLVSGLSRPHGVAVDRAGGKIYWTDYGTDKVQRADLDGQNVEDLVTTNLATPVDIELDAENGMMYWLDQGPDLIWRANLDGSDAEVVLDVPGAGLQSVSRLELDLPRGKMYWTDIEQDTVTRANLDGSELETIHAVSNVGGLALDSDAGKLYWADAGATTTILRANLDGSDVETFISGLSASASLAFDPVFDRLYWHEGRAGRMASVSSDGSDELVLFHEVGDRIRTLDVQAVPTPPAVWLGLAGLAGVVRKRRGRRTLTS